MMYVVQCYLIRYSGVKYGLHDQESRFDSRYCIKIQFPPQIEHNLLYKCQLVNAVYGENRMKHN
jgi:hypothetical protein